jgi:hypothetical protein
MFHPQPPAVSADQLSGLELRKVLDTLHALGDSCAGSGDFARRGIEYLPRLIGSDLTTLVVCDIDSGGRPRFSTITSMSIRSSVRTAATPMLSRRASRT